MDIHSLRKTFNTWLGLAGVASRIARELMRHSHTDLTMGVYTDPALFDLSAAVESPPRDAPDWCLWGATDVSSRPEGNQPDETS